MWQCDMSQKTLVEIPRSTNSFKFYDPGRKLSTYATRTATVKQYITPHSKDAADATAGDVWEYS